MSGKGSGIELADGVCAICGARHPKTAPHRPGAIHKAARLRSELEVLLAQVWAEAEKHARRAEKTAGEGYMEDKGRQHALEWVRDRLNAILDTAPREERSE